MFKKLILTNIQKHPSLTIDLTGGLNLLVGDNEAGKSCIMRGIRWLYGESISTIMREGAKSCSVRAELIDGTIIERSKSKTINRYTLQKPGQAEVVYNTVGKKIPEAIANILQKAEFDVGGEKFLVNFQKQKEPYFFLGEKGSTRMKIFNKLTGNDKLDDILGGYNKDLHGISKGLSELEEQTGQLRETMYGLEAKQRAVIDQLAIKPLFEDVKARQDVINQIRLINDQLIKLTINKDILAKDIANLKYVDIDGMLRAQVERLQQVISIWGNYKQLIASKNETEFAIDELDVPAIDCQDVKNRAEQCLKATKTALESKQLSDQWVAMAEKVKVLNGEIEGLSAKRLELMDKLLIECPKCGHKFKG